jgi:acetyl-CoA acetyltransferase family protein
MAIACHLIKERVMRDVFIVEAVRSPIGRREGGLKGLRADDLAAVTLEELMRRSGVTGEQVDDVILGCVTQLDEQGWNVARLAALNAGLPVSVPAVTVNRMCGSGQQAIHFAAQEIASGDMEVTIAGGIESMSRIKMLSDGKDFSPRLLKKYDLVWQGHSAEMMAEKWKLSRQELDEFSLLSHQKALRAIKENRFGRETFSVAVADGDIASLVTADEGPRADTSLEKLAQLKTVFKENGVITAGNSSQISDGASAVLMASPEKVKELGLKPRARIVARVVAGSDPVIMLDGVIPATQKALAKANLKTCDISVFEINEAFASVVLAWARAIAPDMERVNPNGGAIALGHPLGASGGRLMTTMLHELERTGGRYGLQTMCIGFGMATATIIERL